MLAIGSAAFARHLHLFEPVLRHHYNKHARGRAGNPDDPAFEQEEQAAEERKRSATTVLDKLPRMRPGNAGQAQPRRPSHKPPLSALAYLRTTPLINALSS
ncbi:MAG: hypothetical protein ACLU0O_01815 [Collinsella sp.]